MGLPLCPHCKKQITAIEIIQETSRGIMADQYEITHDRHGFPSFDPLDSNYKEVQIDGMKRYEPQCCKIPFYHQYFEDNIKYCLDDITISMRIET